MPETCRRILAIFRKDARHLWPHAIIFVVVLAFAAISDPIYTRQRSPIHHFYVMSLGLPLACWNLVVAMVQQERLVGDRQYWLTRPYGRGELFAAKALFILVFVHLPVLVDQIAILAAVGIPPTDHISALLWNQVLLGIFLVLPVAAVAAMTRNLTEFVLAAVLISLPLAWLQFQRGGELGWIRTLAPTLILLVGASAILFLQYSRRLTVLSRFAAGVTVLLVIFGASQQRTLAIQKWREPLPERDEVRLRLDLTAARPGRGVVVETNGPIRLDIPIRIEGINPDKEIVTDNMLVGLRGPGIPMGSGANRRGEIRNGPMGRGVQTVYIKRDDFESVQDAPVDLFGRMDLVVFDGRQTFTIPSDARVVIPKVGVCKNLRNPWGLVATIICLTPSPRASVQFESPSGEANWIIPPSWITGVTPGNTGPYFYRGVFLGPWAMWAGPLLPPPTGGLSNVGGFRVLDTFVPHYPPGPEYDGGGKLIVGTPVRRIQVFYNFYSIRLADYATSR